MTVIKPHDMLSTGESHCNMIYSVLQQLSNYETLNIHSNQFISLVLVSCGLWVLQTNGKCHPENMHSQFLRNLNCFKFIWCKTMSVQWNIKLIDGDGVKQPFWEAETHPSRVIQHLSTPGGLKVTGIRREWAISSNWKVYVGITGAIVSGAPVPKL